MTDSPPESSLADARPTLKTIAAETGLAIATVSRALKDAPDIGEETKRRVREAAARLGYRPNRAGVRLRTGKTNVIALVLSTEADVMNHTSQLLYSIARALKGTNYHLVVMPFFPDEDPMTPIRYLVETGSADGIIMNQTRPDDPRVRYMHDHGFPFATHGRTDMGLSHPYFDYDNEAFARVAVRALHARGRKRLMIVAPPRSHSYAHHMLTGFADESARLDLSFEVAEGITSDSPGTQIDDAIARRFAAANPPDGLVLGSTTATMASVAGAERTGAVLGRDFDAVGKEAIPFLKRFRSALIVLPEDVGRAGEFLARAVIAAIERKAPEDSQFLDSPDEAPPAPPTKRETT
ncbi:LacI family DNA-binding transcriptional regulator [Paragemmobacter straminiformis]|uniref:LacI family DNA-binding transcriptional regulator n=1 Tax=Paragemmobacter straminiformis TaxID=2045119 RepID=A0A842IEP7_9RHOB|nr:LacI family DNA-binding transcriptional regulator [Gemmobacter straminiformis]MBC2837384.1 LacI family DNA-binding transcriptional regulator [Gemmobacter straminiformis]